MTCPALSRSLLIRSMTTPSWLSLLSNPAHFHPHRRVQPLVAWSWRMVTPSLLPLQQCLHWIFLQSRWMSTRQRTIWPLKAKNASKIGTAVTVTKSTTRLCETSPGTGCPPPPPPHRQISDTTVAVHLDPDSQPPEATVSSVAIADTASMSPEAAAPTVDAATDTTSVHLAASMADVATVDSLSTDDSENLPVLSSARPEAVVSLTTVAVSEDAVSSTVTNTAAASSSSDETSVDESDWVNYHLGTIFCCRFKPDLEDFTPTIEIRPSSLNNSTEAESVCTISPLASV